MKYSRIMKIVASIACMATLSTAFAASPFAALRQFLPDIAVMDIVQNGDMVYVNVCNLGGALSDSENTLIVAVQKPRGGLISVTPSTSFLDQNGCYNYPVASISDLGITTAGNYNIAAAALLKDGRSDGDKFNNRTAKSVYISYSSRYQPAVIYQNNGTVYNGTTTYSDNNVRLCNQSNNYCADGYTTYGNGPYYYQNSYASTTMYCSNICPPGTVNCPRENNSVSISCDSTPRGSYQYSYNSYPYSDGSRLCTQANNYCADTRGNRVRYNTNNDPSCNARNNYCDSYYNVYNYNNGYNNNNTNVTYGSTRIAYPNGGETIANDFGNQFSFNAYVAANPRNVSAVVINIYKRNTYSGNYEELYKTDRSTPSYNSYSDTGFNVARTFSTSGWTDGDYTAKVIAYDQWNNVLTQDTTDATFHVGVSNSGRSDLVVERIYQNGSDKRIYAQICNRGRDMDRSVSVRTDFTVNGRMATTYGNVQLVRDQCTDSISSVSPAELSMGSNGTYTILARVDANNNVDERDESNNTMTINLSIETQNDRPDLVVDRIWSNDSNGIMSARICNVGGDMSDYNSWSTQMVNTATNMSMSNVGGRLSKGQCMEIGVSYGNLGIYRSGGYNIRVTADTNNAIYEQSESNNTVTQYIQTW